MANDYLECTIHNFKTHNFKTHVSRYIRLLEQGTYRAMIVKRHTRPVGIFMLFDRTSANAENVNKSEP